MNWRKVKRPKIYPEVAPLPTEVPVGESKLSFSRSNVNDFYAFIWLKLRIISYPECFRLFFRLGRASGAKTELQIDLTSSVLHQSLSSLLRKNCCSFLRSSCQSQARNVPKINLSTSPCKQNKRERGGAHFLGAAQPLRGFSLKFCSTQFPQNSLAKFKRYLAFPALNQVGKKQKSKKNMSSKLFCTSFFFKTPRFLKKSCLIWSFLGTKEMAQNDMTER